MRATVVARGAGALVLLGSVATTWMVVDGRAAPARPLTVSPQDATWPAAGTATTRGHAGTGAPTSTSLAVTTTSEPQAATTTEPPAATAPAPTAVPTTTPPPAATPTAPPTTAAPTTGPFVRRVGDRLSVDGEWYRFVGTNVYNANSRWTCWYAMDAAALDQAFVASGSTAMRAWFFQSLVVSGSDPTTWDWTVFDQTLATARAAGVRVVVTLTDHWSACEPGGRKDVEWYRHGYRDSRPTTAAGAPLPATYRDYVAAIVARYRDDPTVLAWQLVNEPDGTTATGACAPDAAAVLQGFTRDMATLIRSIDTNHLVTVGTIGSGQCGTGGEEYAALIRAGNLDWCEVHDYYGDAAFGGDRWNGMQVRRDQCAALGLPFVIGEAGVPAGGDPGHRAAVLGTKLDAAFRHDTTGYLLWGWAAPPAGAGGQDDYQPPPDDPAWQVLAFWSAAVSAG